jgi:hypothetical protein
VPRTPVQELEAGLFIAVVVAAALASARTDSIRRLWPDRLWLIVLTLRMMGTGGDDSSHDDGRDRFEAENEGSGGEDYDQVEVDVDEDKGDE